MSYTPQQQLQQTAFGELNIAENRAYVQNVPVYNLLPANFRQYSTGSGGTTVADKMFTVNTGTTSGSYAAIQSFRALNYRTGQGGIIRFTARFNDGITDSWQGVGLVNLSDELSFGYNGLTFGIWYRTGGYAECREIQVTGASGGSTDLTLTLDSVALTIPLTAGTVQHNAYEIATWINANSAVWTADQIDDKVIISALSDGAKSGTYSYSHATSTGTITAKVAGVAKTSIHIPQASWNQDKCSWLNQQLGNVYQIKYQYLGFGDIKFFIEDPESGDFKLVHIIKYANANELPSLTNPSLRVGLYAVSLGSTTDITVRSGSFAAFTEGLEQRTRNPRAFTHTQTVTTSQTNIMTLRNRKTYNYYTNQVEVEPLFLTVSNEGTKNISVRITTNPTHSGTENFQAVGNNIVIDADISANTITSGTLIAAFNVAPTSTIQVDLSPFRLRIPPSLEMAISAKVTSGSTSVVSASLTWYEDLS